MEENLSQGQIPAVGPMGGAGAGAAAGGLPGGTVLPL